MLPRPPFASLEREFKQGLPVIVSNDYPPAVGGLPFKNCPFKDPPFKDPLFTIFCARCAPSTSASTVPASSMPSWSSTVIWPRLTWKK